jgi:hypothetical protein
MDHGFMLNVDGFWAFKSDTRHNMSSEACCLNMSGKPRLHLAFCNANYTFFRISLLLYALDLLSLSLCVCVTLSPRPFESRYTLLLEFCRIWAIFLAFSNSLRSTYDLLFLMASPISSAERASPWARTTVACFSWRALSTTKAARWASC